MEKKLGSTSSNARINLRLKFCNILKMFYQIFSITQNLYYPRLRLRENDKDPAIHAVDSSHLAYRKLIYDFRNSLISLAISSLPEGLLVLFYKVIAGS